MTPDTPSAPLTAEEIQTGLRLCAAAYPLTFLWSPGTPARPPKFGVSVAGTFKAQLWDTEDSELTEEHILRLGFAEAHLADALREVERLRAETTEVLNLLDKAIQNSGFDVATSDFIVRGKDMLALRAVVNATPSGTSATPPLALDDAMIHRIAVAIAEDQHEGVKSTVRPGGLPPYWWRVFDASVADLEQIIRAAIQSDAAAGPMPPAAKCSREVCNSTNANCQHTQTGKMYCLACAVAINSQPGQEGLVNIPSAAAGRAGELAQGEM